VEAIGERADVSGRRSYVSFLRRNGGVMDEGCIEGGEANLLGFFKIFLEKKLKDET